MRIHISGMKFRTLTQQLHDPELRFKENSIGLMILHKFPHYFFFLVKQIYEKPLTASSKKTIVEDKIESWSSSL